MIKAKVIERCMNYFHFDCTPYRDEFLQQAMLPFEQKTKLDMGFHKADDPNQKTSTFAILKEKQRLKKMIADNPKCLYLIETVGNCLRCLRVPQSTPL